MPRSPRETLIAILATPTSAAGTAPGSRRSPSRCKVFFCAMRRSNGECLHRLLELLTHHVATAAFRLLDRVIQRGKWLPPGDNGRHAVEAELVQLRYLGDVGR